MNPGPGQERGDRRRLAGQTGSSQVLYIHGVWSSIDCVCKYVLCR